MIRGNMNPFNVEIRGSEVDSYGQPSTSFTFWKTVDISVNVKTQSVNSADIRYVDSTHLGLTFDKTLKEGMRITTDDKKYLINLVNNDGRMAQLILQEV